MIVPRNAPEKRWLHLGATLATGAWLVLVVGCAAMKTKGPLAESPARPPAAPQAASTSEPNPPPVEPAKLAVTWSEAVFTAPGGTPTRGFGGRVYFYDAQQQAVPVAGELVVYAFDDLRAPAAAAPQRKYVVRAHELPRHFGATQLGPSYSVWVPWDAAGGPEQPVSLLARFTSAGGRTIAGESTRVVLAGPKEKSRSTPWREGETVRAVSYEEGLEPAAQQRLPAQHSARPETTTIALPPSLQQRLAHAAEPLPPRALAANPAEFAPAAAAVTAPPPVHSVPGPPRVLGAPIARPIRGPAPWRPFPSALPHPSAGQFPEGPAG